jgi:hypothetical protein
MATLFCLACAILVFFFVLLVRIGARRVPKPRALRPEISKLIQEKSFHILRLPDMS